MALQRAGIDSIVYEAHDRPADYVGLFLNTASNGLNVLKTPGFLQLAWAGDGISKAGAQQGGGYGGGTSRTGTRGCATVTVLICGAGIAGQERRAGSHLAEEHLDFFLSCRYTLRRRQTSASKRNRCRER